MLISIMSEFVIVQYVVDEVPLFTVSRNKIFVCYRRSKSLLFTSGIRRPPKTISALTAVSYRSVVREPLPTCGVSTFVVLKVLT